MEGPFRMPENTVVTDELAGEQAYLEHARRELARMREKTLSARASGGDRVSDEFLAMTLARRAAGLVDDPTTALFFGRLDMQRDSTRGSSGGTRGAEPPERWYIGRRHVNDELGDPVVIDWRAELSGAFYRASRGQPMGVRLRRRFGVDHGRLTAYEDEIGRAHV